MSCKNCGQYTEFRQIFCSESCSIADHERAHPDPEDYVGECELCAEKVETAKREWNTLEKIVEADIEYKREIANG